LLLGLSFWVWAARVACSGLDCVGPSTGALGAASVALPGVVVTAPAGAEAEAAAGVVDGGEAAAGELEEEVEGAVGLVPGIGGKPAACGESLRAGRGATAGRGRSAGHAQQAYLTGCCYQANGGAVDELVDRHCPPVPQVPGPPDTRHTPRAYTHTFCSPRKAACRRGVRAVVKAG
jgi:hypothetical protein